MCFRSLTLNRRDKSQLPILRGEPIFSLLQRKIRSRSPWILESNTFSHAARKESSCRFIRSKLCLVLTSANNRKCLIPLLSTPIKQSNERRCCTPDGQRFE